MLEKTLKESLALHGDQTSQSLNKSTRILIGRTDAGAEAPVFRAPVANSRPFGEDPDAGEDWGQKDKGTTEDEMAGWHHQLDGHGFGWTLGVGEGQGGLACCDSWGR